MNNRHLLTSLCLILLLSTAPMAARKNNRKPDNPKENVTVVVDMPLDSLMVARRIEKELALSQNGGPYFIFDLDKAQIELKNRGTQLRVWTLKELALYGDPVPFEQRELLVKETPTPPRRDKIKPGEPPAPALTASGKFQLTSYEIEDMPIRYKLIFQGQIEVHVLIGESGGFWKRTGRFLSKLWREATLPLRTIQSRIKHQSFTRLDWIMTSEQEAQSLYWVCGEKIPWLFIFPPARE